MKDAESRESGWKFFDYKKCQRLLFGSRLENICNVSCGEWFGEKLKLSQNNNLELDFHLRSTFIDFRNNLFPLYELGSTVSILSSRNT